MMIIAMIQPEPKNRPKVSQLEQHEFMMSGYCPPSLPVSCLTMSPRFDQFANNNNQRKPLLEINSEYAELPTCIICKNKQRKVV